MEKHGKDLEIIKGLMEQLIEEMEYGTDDFEHRLGRKKPDIEVMKIGVEGPGLEKSEEKLDMGEVMGRPSSYE
jgi:hypothetical protein